MTSVFSTTGNMGAVGTTKDTLRDGSGLIQLTITDTVSGETSTLDLNITKLSITTAAQTLTAGTASSSFTVQTQNALGAGVDVSADRTLDLSSSSSTGSFSIDNFSTTTTQVTISSGANSTTFLYKDVVSGTPTITVTDNPSQGWTDATQQQTVNPAALSSTDVEPATLTQDSVPNVTVTFTTINPLPSDGKILVTFPSGFTLNSGSSTAVSSEDFEGTASVTGISGQEVTITRSGSDPSPLQRCP